LPAEWLKRIQRFHGFPRDPQYSSRAVDSTVLPCHCVTSAMAPFQVQSSGSLLRNHENASYWLPCRSSVWWRCLPGFFAPNTNRSATLTSSERSVNALEQRGPGARTAWRASLRRSRGCPCPPQRKREGPHRHKALSAGNGRYLMIRTSGVAAPNCSSKPSAIPCKRAAAPRFPPTCGVASRPQ